ncbi:MAG: NAD-dependent epimerase/dehydratase family protein [Parcubacteria group bacterium]
MSNQIAMVVGGAGFIGSHLVEALLIRGLTPVVVDNFSLGGFSNLPEGVVSLDVDATDHESLGGVLARWEPDVVFNLAVVPLPASLSDPKGTFDENVQIVSTLCELHRAGMYDTLVHFSSSEVYGSVARYPQDEAHPLNGCTPYAASKAAGDLLIQSYARTFGMDFVIVRPFNTIGERQNSGSYAGVVPATIIRCLRGEPAVIHGDGEFTRDYSYVGDVVNAAIDLYATPAAHGEITNIGSGVEISVSEIISYICELFDDHPIIHDSDRPGDVARMCAGTAKARALIGYAPAISFEDAIERTVLWYVKNWRD